MDVVLHIVIKSAEAKGNECAELLRGVTILLK